MKLRNILIIMFVLLSIQIKAQVTINSDVKPESFCLVQVEGDKSGVRLPRMTTTEMTGLIPTLKADARSTGLVIFNETAGANRIEFWDGDNWIPLTGAISGTNGIEVSGSTIELGGNMTENTTTIDQKTFDLNFTNSTGEFKINNSTVKAGDVNFVPNSNFTVNTNAMNVAGGNIMMNAEKLTVNTNTLVMENSGNTTVNGTFNYSHTSLQEGHVLASDALGNARWEGLRPFGTVVKGSLYNNVGFSKTSGNDVDITETALVLEPGRWVIFAKCTARANGYTSFMYHWISLVASPSINAFEIKTGVNPELITGSTNTAYSCPNLVYFANITQTTTYKIKIGTSNDLADKTTSEYGGSYFYAVRIDVSD